MSLQLVGGSGYRSAKRRCWKCGESTVVWNWPGHVMWDDQEPPKPIPSNVRWAYSGAAMGDYWANVCEHCGAVQGDWYLYMEPDRPFFGFVL